MRQIEKFPPELYNVKNPVREAMAQVHGLIGFGYELHVDDNDPKMKKLHQVYELLNDIRDGGLWRDK